ncbi:MAG: 6-phosphogluconolactonase [Gammaproteobacteria bacterium]|nr:6-phosphogluconolactonase [Gammaproteobacteria bacterium]
MQQIRRWHIYPNIEDLELHAVRAILRAAAQAIELRGHFSIVLAGGDTPQRLYAQLAGAVSDWGRWHIYFGDERCLPAGHTDRNDQRARQVWLNHVAIPGAQIRPISAEFGPEKAATLYADRLAPVELFDLVLLGLGEDGHTASLFPGLWNPSDTVDVLPVREAPKPPSERVTLSARRLSRAQQVLFVVAGAHKREAMAAWRRGDAIPAAGIVPALGVEILVDATAWPDGMA